MNPRTVTTVIDPEKCIGCGSCIRVCPSQTITLVDGIARVTGEKSLSCGHCAAVCPEQAIQVDALDRGMTKFDTFELEEDWLGFGKSSTKDLVQLLASRRSCRHFKNQAVDKAMLLDLIKIGALAPSATNSQAWTFTCLPDRKSVLECGHLIWQFFEKVNSKAEKRWLRKGLRFLGMPDLDNYYDEYYESVTHAITQMKENQVDRLFHGATACILVGSNAEASCPKEDAMLAVANILTAAHTMGLGTCLVGFAVSAMKADRSIQTRLNIPADEKIYAVIALGHPDESYLRVTGRKKPVIRFRHGSTMA
jgi:nitroreductase/NAD-dependent dihydropyrimidine dehydrogenase PreA subunit